jgi:hypothetical protein
MKGKLKWNNNKIVIETESEEFDLDESQWQEVIDKNLIGTEINFNEVIEIDEIENELKKLIHLYYDRTDDQDGTVFSVFKHINENKFILIMCWFGKIILEVEHNHKMIERIENVSLSKIIETINKYLTN